MGARVFATCCLCVPLRLGVFLNAVATVAWSAFTILFHEYLQETIRLFSGGHVMESRCIIGFIEYLGCIWGTVGIIGAWKQQASFIAIFKFYQVIRVIAWFGMLCTDVPLVMQCELWTQDIDRALHAHGWNPVMYNIAIRGNCWDHRVVFLLIATSAFFWFGYLAYVNHRYHMELEDEPRYLLKVPHMAPSGAFFSKPTNEWSALLAQHDMVPRSYHVEDQYFHASTIP